MFKFHFTGKQEGDINVFYIKIKSKAFSIQFDCNKLIRELKIFYRFYKITFLFNVTLGLSGSLVMFERFIKT
jgi:hypothetical protein